MKFRSDFVTNSSSSSFLAFNIRNIKLLRYLEEVGFTFELAEEGRFTQNMKVMLPSGLTAEIDTENFWPPVLDRDTESFSAWLVAMILSGMYTPDGFMEEAWALVEKAGILDEEQSEMLSEYDDQEEYSEKLSALLQDRLAELDEGITEAEYEYAYGFEAEVGPIVYDRVKDGTRRKFFFEDLFFADDGIFPEDEELDDSDLYALPFEGNIKEVLDRSLIKPCIQKWDNKAKAWLPPLESWEYELRDDDEDEDEDEDEEDHESCEGKTFVITGKLEYFGNRDEMVEYIEDNGGRVSGSVSSKTDLLISNDPDTTSSKMKKAKELGIPVITEEEFIARFGSPEDDF